LHVNLVSSTEEFEQLGAEMVEYGTQECNSRTVVKVPSKGEYYLCRDEDDEFFRVKILDINEKDVWVEYVDFGEKDALPLTSQLFPLKTSFYDVPFQAINVVPKDFMECSNNAEVMHEINNCLLHKELMMEVVSDYDDDTLPIVTFSDLDNNPLTPERIFGSLPRQVNPGWLQYLEARINNCPDLLNFNNFVSHPEPNKVYVAFNPDVKRFCRVVVVGDDVHFFTLKYIDYGTTFAVPKYLLNGASFEPEIGMNLNDKFN